MVIVLGIDPGTASTGYGVVVASRGRLAALDGGVIGTDGSEPLERRLTRIHARVCDLIKEHAPQAVAIEAAGVGYRLAVSAQTLRSVPAAGSEALLHAHLVIRDDGMHLYGFASEEERELFHMLIGVQGVGPKVALAVLSGGTTRELLRAIGAGDGARFQAVPGIGKRTADRIIVELREKVAGQSGAGDEIIIPRADDDPRSLPRQGLVGLGF